MIKGCCKNVVWVRNTGSEWFDEAYFLISGTAEEKMMSKKDELDIVKEADKIISETPFASYFGLDYTDKFKKPKELLILTKLKWFTVGALFSSLIAILLGIII